ncbi:methyltransferase [Emcibacter sp. SYSU 3D8]|uniref:tRNA1(Val) (adenine(37)-N6)-methyltransferase n=1 Tax=Emcibacter sp. SYSU 3D8 TaxID=3133969 RepID=UPI0031FE5FE4
MNEPALTDDTLLGGRVRLFQPKDGYRAAIDPVLLAAAVPARSGHTVLDVGSGTGAAGLCLAARIPGIELSGIERDPGALALAQRSAGANGVSVDWIEGDVLAPPSAVLSRQYDHVISNPPYRSADRGQRSPDPARAAAHSITDADFDAWLAFCVARVRGKGTLSLVLPAGELSRAVALIEPRLGGLTLLPLWPKQGAEARRVILQARRGGRAPSRLLPGLVLHAQDGRYTPEAEQVLRHGAPL